MSFSLKSNSVFICNYSSTVGVIFYLDEVHCFIPTTAYFIQIIISTPKSNILWIPRNETSVLVQPISSIYNHRAASVHQVGVWKGISGVLQQRLELIVAQKGNL